MAIEKNEVRREVGPAPESREHSAPAHDPEHAAPSSPSPAKPEKAKPEKKARDKKQKNNVRKIRMERMMSKAELARRAGMSTLTIDRVERGLPCRMDTKRKILEALGLKPSDRVMVFGDEGGPEDAED